MDYTVFRKLPAGTLFYRGLDSQGGLKILQPPLGTDHGAPRLPPAAAMALALTGIGLELGIGKVFQGSQFKCQTDRATSNKAYPIFAKLPNLLYQPFVWSDDDKQEWRQLQARDQLSLLSSRIIQLFPEEPLLPIALEFPGQDYEHVRISGYTTAGVTVVVAPQPYVAYTEDLRAAFDNELRMIKRDKGVALGLYFSGERATVREHAVADGRAIMEKLQGMFYNDRDGYHTNMVLERRAFLKASDEAKAAGRPCDLDFDSEDDTASEFEAGELDEREDEVE